MYIIIIIIIIMYIMIIMYIIIIIFLSQYVSVPTSVRASDLRACSSGQPERRRSVKSEENLISNFDGWWMWVEQELPGYIAAKIAVKKSLCSGWRIESRAWPSALSNCRANMLTSSGQTRSLSVWLLTEWLFSTPRAVWSPLRICFSF